MRNKFLTSPFFIFLLVLVLIWLTVALGKELYNRYQIHKRIVQLEKEIKKIKEENQSLSQMVEQFNSPEWLEKDARLKFNLAKEGEKVVIIHQPIQENFTDEDFKKEEQLQLKNISNPEKWWKFFFSKSD